MSGHGGEAEALYLKLAKGLRINELLRLLAYRLRATSDGRMDLWSQLNSVAFGLGVAILALTLAIRIDGNSVLRRLALRRAAARAAERLPFPVWIKTTTSVVEQAPAWANEAFHRLPPGDRSRLLREKGRLTLGTDGEGESLERQQIGDLGFALPCDDLVRAETNLRELLQTMTLTFAQLPIGVAVFDAERRLSSFNPVLVELTGLSPNFLSRRPNLTAMLDAMRDRSMVPEPANWKDWRASLANMERAAAQGTFEDIWALPGGQTYRVSGRQHRGGGLALMIEDISSEILRGRRYRASLDLCQNVIDRMDEAIVVFAASGQLVLSNTAYANLWGQDPGGGVQQLDLRQLTPQWRAASAPTALWAELEAYGELTEDRRAWQGEARLTDGRLILCRCEPMTEGAMLVGFRTVPAEGPQKTILTGSA